MDTGQIVELIGNIGIIVASGAAVWGVSAWRREFKGKRDMQLAEDVLCLFYRTERAIDAIRCWLSYSFEAETRPAQPGETPEQTEARNRAYVVIKRIQDHAEVFDQLYALRFRFMARFGRETAKSFDEAKQIINRMQISARSLAELWAEQLRTSGDLSEATVKQVRKHEEVIWAVGEPDEIGADVKRIIAEVEAVCRPIIEGRVSWLSRLWRKAFPRKDAAKLWTQLSSTGGSFSKQ